MSNPCVKIKPKRKPRPEPKSYYQVCKCNHQIYRHKDHFFSGFGGCELCECERYDYIGLFTLGEWQSLEECKD